MHAYVTPSCHSQSDKEMCQLSYSRCQAPCSFSENFRRYLALFSKHSGCYVRQVLGIQVGFILATRSVAFVLPAKVPPGVGQNTKWYEQDLV